MLRTPDSHGTKDSHVTLADLPPIPMRTSCTGAPAFWECGDSGSERGFDCAGPDSASQRKVVAECITWIHMDSMRSCQGLSIIMTLLDASQACFLSKDLR